jgi:hypothetical protein
VFRFRICSLRSFYSFYRDYWFHCCQRLRCGAAAAAAVKSGAAAAAAEHLLLSCLLLLLLLLLQQNARVDCQQNWNWQQHISLT